MRQSEIERLSNDDGGFTLVELLIVIVILAILAAIVVFAVQGLSGSSARAACESDLQTVDHAVQAYRAQTGKVPTQISSLMPTDQVPGVNGDLVGPWLHNAPSSSNHYEIFLTDGSTKYTVSGATAPAAGYAVVETYSGGAFQAAPGGAIYAPSGGVPGAVGSTSLACSSISN